MAFWGADEVNLIEFKWRVGGFGNVAKLMAALFRGLIFLGGLEIQAGRIDAYVQIPLKGRHELGDVWCVFSTPRSQTCVVHRFDQMYHVCGCPFGADNLCMNKRFFLLASVPVRHEQCWVRFFA